MYKVFTRVCNTIEYNMPTNILYIKLTERSSETSSRRAGSDTADVIIN